MPDITMCRGYECEVCDSCYRYLAKPDKHWQSWFTEMPIPTGEECVYYWPVKSQITARTQQVEGKHEWLNNQ
jgi:hypothetical protein